MFVPDERTLGKDVGLPIPTANRFPYDLFRMSKSIDRRRINPVNAQVKRPLDRGNRFLIVLWPPASIPTAGADRRCAQPSGSCLHICIPRLSCLQEKCSTVESVLEWKT